MNYRTMAFSTASARAVESLLPEENRLFIDEYSLQLIPTNYQVILKLMKMKWFYNFVINLREKQTPGVLGGLLCRTRYIDDTIVHAVENDFEAVVNLGAGMDTRIFRIPGIESLEVYELDHPSTIEAKIDILEKRHIKLPENTKLVPIDFNTQNLKEALHKAGYSPSKKTLFIMEGVTQYISKETLDGTMAYVSQSVNGSRLVFTYILEEFIVNRHSFESLDTLRKLLKRQEVSWLCGFNPDELGNYLAAYNLAIVEDVGDLEYKERYLKPIGRELAIMPIERIVWSEIKRN